MTGKKLAEICPLFDVLKDYYCVAVLRSCGVFVKVPDHVRIDSVEIVEPLELSDFANLF